MICQNIESTRRNYESILENFPQGVMIYELDNNQV